MTWSKKHLLDIESLTAGEITTILDTAKEFKAVGERAIKKVPALRGKTVVNLFIEPSTRTRVSFELAAQRLTADIINFSAEASSFRKGETLKDTALNLQALNADIITWRMVTAIIMMKKSSIPVICATWVVCVRPCQPRSGCT